MLEAIKCDFADSFRGFLFSAGKSRFSVEAPPLDLEIVESLKRVLRWGHEMVSVINGLATVGEYSFITLDPLLGIYM
jgi:hypothetical protein